MPILILSDIHSNIEALDAVLADAAPSGYTSTICLGDLVGYGASPIAVLDRVEALAARWLIRGNHDRVCAGISDAETFSPTARQAIEWTRRQLPPARVAWLAALPTGPIPLGDTTTLCHGAPFDEDFYVLGREDAWLALADLERLAGPAARLCLHGHTHLQTVFCRRGPTIHDETPSRRARWVVHLAAGRQWLVNPGSVGQPRDGDPRAAYALLDEEAGTVELRRVRYDVAGAQQRIKTAGLPEMLATRLSNGE